MTILIVRLEVRNRVVSDLLARCSVLARAFDNDDDAQRWIAAQVRVQQEQREWEERRRRDGQE